MLEAPKYEFSFLCYKNTEYTIIDVYSFFKKGFTGIKVSSIGRHRNFLLMNIFSGGPFMRKRVYRDDKKNCQFIDFGKFSFVKKKYFLWRSLYTKKKGLQRYTNSVNFVIGIFISIYIVKKGKRVTPILYWTCCHSRVLIP